MISQPETYDWNHRRCMPCAIPARQLPITAMVNRHSFNEDITKTLYFNALIAESMKSGGLPSKSGGTKLRKAMLTLLQYVAVLAAGGNESVRQKQEGSGMKGSPRNKRGHPARRGNFHGTLAAWPMRVEAKVREHIELRTGTQERHAAMLRR